MGLQVRTVRYIGDILLLKVFGFSRLTPPSFVLHDAATNRETDMTFQTMETAPKDGTLILVWFDHEADPYQDPHNPDRLTDYAAWCEGGDFLDGHGYCIARWFDQFWEVTDEYGGGYWLPAWWFAAEMDDFERVVNPVRWMPLPDPGVKPGAKS